jgi:hypothetical protein
MKTSRTGNPTPDGNRYGTTPTAPFGIVGKVIENAPFQHRVTNWAGISEADDPSKHSRVSYDIVPCDGMVRLTVMHAQLEPGSAMAAGVGDGWPVMLSSLKSFLETGQEIDVFAKPNEAALAA